jgi:hypothetical protein
MIAASVAIRFRLPHCNGKTIGDLRTKGPLTPLTVGTAYDGGETMRINAMPALAALCAFAVGFLYEGATPAQAQSVPVQTEQTPGQADQSRAQDRSRAEDTKIGRDWKAQETDGANGGNVDSDRSHETVGRDWRAHPEGQDR